MSGKTGYRAARSSGTAAALPTLLAALLAGVAVSLNPGTTLAQTCAGDCNGDGKVSVDELVLGVNIALGDAGMSACANLDVDSSNRVEINELVLAVVDALDGCPVPTAPTKTVASTPFRTATAAHTPSLTPTNTPTSTFTVTSTHTSISTPTSSPTITPTATPTETPIQTPTRTPTSPPTQPPSATPTSTPTATLSRTPTGTPTGTPTITRTVTRTLTATATRCPTECGDRWCEAGESPETCDADCGYAAYLVDCSGDCAGQLTDYWVPVDMPVVTTEILSSYCGQSPEQWEAFYAAQETAAVDLSDRIEAYVRAWLAGEQPAQLPQGLLPKSMDNAKTHSWTLMTPEQAQPEEQWYWYPARPEPYLDGFANLYMNNAATHVTYLKLIFLAPLHSTLIVEGEFPHAREMSFHISEPFDPRFPHSHNMGVMEVPLVDVDIDPEPGHTNPFRGGQSRTASDRRYTVRFELEMGNATDLNAVMRDAHFRAPGNMRIGGPFSAAGPRGDGALVPAVLWLRYYAPDKNPDGTVDPLAQVPLPRARLRLSTGEEFWLQADLSLAKERQLTTAPGQLAWTPPMEPTGDWEMTGPSLGWSKLFTIMLTYMEYRAYQATWSLGPLAVAAAKKQIREQSECLFNQGPTQGSPGSIGHSATDMPYNSYLVRPLLLGQDKVYVIHGRLPTTPATRNGEGEMTAAQARYWSICHTADPQLGDVKYNKLGFGCLMDDEISVNANRDYLVAYSRSNERPVNARAECGVTWQAFGPASAQSFVIRWMSVYPDHAMEDYAPTDEAIPWEIGAWSQPGYDPSAIENRMGPYYPQIHYLSRAEFEALGCPDGGIDASSLPPWQ
jgi:hypothetical protein